MFAVILLVSFAAAASANCTKCPAGSYCNNGVCTLCPAGSYSTSVNSASCSLCGTTQYQNQAGQTACLDCPSPVSQWTAHLGATDVSFCVCKEGYYSPALLKSATTSAAEACESCPTGAICLGEDAIPLPQSGYWAQNQSADFFPCEWSTKACAGISVAEARARVNTDYSSFCAEGHYGFMCNTCTEREYYMLGGVCNKCSIRARMIILGLCLGALFGLVIGVMLLKIDSTTTLTACVQYFQVLTVINRMGGNWPQEMQYALQFIATINFDPDVLQLNCDATSQGSQSPFSSFLMQMSLPFLALIVALAAAGVIHVFAKYKKLPDDFRVEKIAWVRIMFMQFLTLLYMPFTIRAIEVINCKNLNGKTYQPEDPAVTCYDSAYNTTFLPVSIIMIVFFVIGVPALFCQLFYSCRDGIELDEYDKTYAFFWRNYKPEYFWWNLVLVFRKLGIGLSVALLRSYPFFQAIASIVVWLGAMSFHFYARPYKFKTLDRLDDVLFLIMLAIFFLCLLYRTQVQNISNPSKEIALPFQLFVLILAIIAFLVLSAYVVVEIKVGTIKAKVKQTAVFLKSKPRDKELDDKTQLLNFTRFLIAEKILPESVESWLLYKADDEQKMQLQRFYQSLSETLDPEKKDGEDSSSTRPTSFLDVTFSNNTSAQVLRFLIECGDYDRRVFRRFMMGIKLELARRDVLDNSIPILLADWLTRTEDEVAVGRCRDVLTALQASYDKDNKDDKRKKKLNVRQTDNKGWELSCIVSRGIDLKAMDYGVSSDPYVWIKYGRQKAKTKVIDKNLNPQWEEEFTLMISDAKTPLIVECWDEDFTSDDMIGTATVDLTLIECLAVGVHREFIVQLIDEESEKSGQIVLILSRQSGVPPEDNNTDKMEWMSPYAAIEEVDAPPALPEKKKGKTGLELQPLKSRTNLTMSQREAFKHRLHLAMFLRESRTAPRVTDAVSDVSGSSSSSGSVTDTTTDDSNALFKRRPATLVPYVQKGNPITAERAQAKLIAHKVKGITASLQKRVQPEMNSMEGTREMAERIRGQLADIDSQIKKTPSAMYVARLKDSSNAAAGLPGEVAPAIHRPPSPPSESSSPRSFFTHTPQSRSERYQMAMQRTLLGLSAPSDIQPLPSTPMLNPRSQPKPSQTAKQLRKESMLKDLLDRTGKIAASRGLDVSDEVRGRLLSAQASSTSGSADLFAVIC